MFRGTIESRRKRPAPSPAGCRRQPSVRRPALSTDLRRLALGDSRWTSRARHATAFDPGGRAGARCCTKHGDRGLRAARGRGLSSLRGRRRHLGGRLRARAAVPAGAEGTEEPPRPSRGRIQRRRFSTLGAGKGDRRCESWRAGAAGRRVPTGVAGHRGLSAYRYRGRPITALQGIDANGRVAYVGTFSKTMFPALRVGYVIAPEGLAAAFAHAVRNTGQSVPQPVQGHSPSSSTPATTAGMCAGCERCTQGAARASSRWSANTCRM